MKDTFDGFHALHTLFSLHDALAQADKRLVDAKADIERIAIELAAAELEVAASFDVSPIKAVAYQHKYENHAVALVDGTLRVLPLGSAFQMVDPSLSATEVEMAAHAAVETVSEEEAGLDLYDALRATA